MLSLSKKYYIEFYQKQLEKLTKAKEKFSSEKAIEAKRKAAWKTLEKLQEDMTENVCEIPFDELGINSLFVDEAHNYKNVSLHSGIMRIRGITNQGSAKCDAMMDKVHCVQRQNGGGRVVMTTGTPITNSITDLFIMQKFLQDGELEFLGIGSNRIQNTQQHSQGRIHATHYKVVRRVFCCERERVLDG